MSSPMLPPILTPPAMMTTAAYMTIFMMTGVHLPFWPLWLGDWGLTGQEVGLFTALGMGVRVVAGVAIPALADRLDRRRQVMAACLAVSVGLFLAHHFIGSKGMLLAATLALGVAMAATGPLSEALGVAASQKHRFPYAQTRGLGSLGFVLANLLVGGLLAQMGIGLALWWIVGCLCLAIPLALRHPGGAAAPSVDRPRFAEIGVLLVNPVFVLFVVTCGFLQSSHAVFFALGSVHWAQLGLGEALIGWLWAASVMTEIVFMVAAGAWTVARLGPVGAMALSGVAGVVRWTAMAFDPVGWALWPLQGLHAATFGAGHLGAMAFIAQAIPSRYGAAAQGAMGAMAVGLMLALAMALAAALYPRLGGGTYAIGAILSGVGLALCVILGRRWRGGALPV